MTVNNNPYKTFCVSMPCVRSHCYYFASDKRNTNYLEPENIVILLTISKVICQLTTQLNPHRFLRILIVMPNLSPTGIIMVSLAVATVKLKPWPVLISCNIGRNEKKLWPRCPVSHWWGSWSRDRSSPAFCTLVWCSLWSKHRQKHAILTQKIKPELSIQLCSAVKSGLIFNKVILFYIYKIRKMLWEKKCFLRSIFHKKDTMLRLHVESAPSF